jgi:hypothetical protein
MPQYPDQVFVRLTMSSSSKIVTGTLFGEEL